jgi:hypothetical protein
MTDDITKELAEIVRRFRLYTDSNTSATSAFMVRVDAALELYEHSCKPKMTINLKDYANKLVVVTLRNEWMLVSLVIFNEGPDYDTYTIDGKYYSDYGKVFGYDVASPYDIIDIKLAEEDPEPVITRVEVITDTREYVHWNPYNKITTSLQDDGRTLKVFVTQNTEETMYPKQPKPINMMEIETKRWATALSGLIDELGGDSPALWEWEGKTPTPERLVEYLRELMKYREQLVADEELEACCAVMEMNEGRVSGNVLRAIRRPKPTLKSQALKDFETVRKHSDLLPEILDTIENALKSLPDT